MLSRLFRLVFLIVIAIAIGRLLLKPQERLRIRSWVETLAVALLISSAIFVLLRWWMPEAHL